MAISIGDAVLKVGVDTRDLDKGMKGIGASIKKHQKAIGIGMIAVGGAILAAGALSIKTFAQMGDAVQKMALRTGFSTEALSELKHAADISGASLETLEKGIKKMSKTIVDASDGLATYVRSFEKIGLTAEELMELSPEEQFDKITMAIAALESPTLRAAVAQDIFGRAGTQLLPLLAAGADGIRELREEAHKLGIVFDQEAADKAAEFTDALTRLNEAISGVKKAIAIELTPIITEFLETKIIPLIEKIIAWAEENPKLARTLTLTTMAVGGLLIALGGLLVMLPSLKAGILILATGIGLLISPIGLIAAAVLYLITVGFLVAKHWGTITADLLRLWKSIEAVGVRAFGAVAVAVQSAIDYVMSLYELLQKLWRMLKMMMGLEITPAAPVPVFEPPGALIPAGSFQTGGIVAQTGLAMVHKGETVIPKGQPTTNVFHIYLDGEEVERTISERIIREVRLQGG